MVTGYQYQDYNKVNFDIPREMQLQIRDVKRWQDKVNDLKSRGESAQQCLQGR